MYNFLTQKGQLVAFGLGVLITIVFLLSVFGGLDGFEALADEDRGTTGIFNAGLYGAIVLCILCAAAILLFGVYHTVTNPKGAMKFLIGLGLILVIFIIFYSMATPVTEGDGRLFTIMQKFEITDGANKFISGALSTTLVLAVIAVAAFIFSEIRNLFK